MREGEKMGERKDSSVVTIIDGTVATEFKRVFWEGTRCWEGTKCPPAPVTTEVVAEIGDLIKDHIFSQILETIANNDHNDKEDWLEASESIEEHSDWLFQKGCFIHAWAVNWDGCFMIEVPAAVPDNYYAFVYCYNESAWYAAPMIGVLPLPSLPYREEKEECVEGYVKVSWPFGPL
ncbi:MAG: hypothetical protein WCX88_02140 [Patescibacteria group bacterium]